MDPQKSHHTGKGAQPFKRTIQPIPARQARPLRTDREAAAEIMRSTIDHIYDTDSPHKEAEEIIAAQNSETSLAEKSVYAQTHGKSATEPDVAAQKQWQQYHSAWQNYYQQYYERYYLGQLNATRKQIEARAQAAVQPVTVEAATTPLTTDQAVNDLRSELLHKVKQSAGKVRRSRHFMPLVCAVAVGAIFMFLQYNRLLIAQVEAYVSPGNIEPQNIVLDPTTNVKVDNKPRLIIPKINVDAPVVYGLTSIAENDVQKALESGVVHYPIPGADSLPGQAGNTVIIGHSSNDVFDNGAYKFIFVQLDKLQEGDTFYAHYKGTRYTYSVTKKEIILPTEVSKLAVTTKKPLLTLITCTPPGTALKRLIVTAEQISPDPDKAAATTAHSKDKPAELPSYSPTIFERLFGN